MKKFFTLIAAVAMAASMNAQTETVVIPALADGVKSETYSGEKTLKTVNAQIVLGADGETFTVKPGKLANDAPYVSYIQGAANPKDADGKGYSTTSANLPTKGCYYVFSASKPGKVEIGMQLGNNKSFFVCDGETGQNSVTKTLIDKKGATVTLGVNTDASGKEYPESVAEKFYGTVNFNVEANKSYYVFCTGSKLAFYGYQFTPGTDTGISNINASEAANEAATFNLMGQKVASNAKGLVIKNGRKFINK